MLNSADEWEVSVKRFRFTHTALDYAYKHNLFNIYDRIEVVKIS